MSDGRRAVFLKARGKVLKIDGAFAPKVLKFDTACGCEGCGGRPAGASINAACGRAPLWWLAPPPSPAKAVGLWMLGNGVKLSLWQQRSENHTTGLRPWKTNQPPCGRGNAPLLPPAAASPPEGQILVALCFEVLMSPKAERRANFPLRGKYRRRRG